MVIIPVQDDEKRRQQKYLLTTGEQRHFYIDQSIYDLIKAVEAAADLDNAIEEVCKLHPKLPKSHFLNVLNQRLLPFGIIQHQQTRSQPQISRTSPPSDFALRRYVLFKCTLFPASASAKITKAFHVLYRPKVLKCLPLLCFAAIGLMFYIGRVPFSPTYMSQAVSALTLTEIVSAIGLVVAILLFHEIGHSSAASYYGKTPGRIGFGLYWMFPVLFSDMSTTWALTNKKRVVVDLGGVYFQLLATTLLMALANAGIKTFLLSWAAYVSFISILWTLNPLLRFDGYWVYSDYFGCINLRQRAIKYVLNRISYLVWWLTDGRGQNTFNFYRVRSPVFVYAFFASVFMGFFFVFAVRYEVAYFFDLIDLSNIEAAIRKVSFAGYDAIFISVAKFAFNVVILYIMIRAFVLLGSGLLKAIREAIGGKAQKFPAQAESETSLSMRRTRNEYR